MTAWSEARSGPSHEANASAGKRTIVIISMEPWADMWYSKQHYAAQLAKNDEVFFVSLPDRWRWRDLFSMRASMYRSPEGVSVVEYRNNLPLRLIGTRLGGLMSRFNALKVARLLPRKAAVIWSFFPTSLAGHLARAHQGSRVIYHVVDPFIHRPNDRSFARMADLVVAINPWYLRHYNRLNDKCILIPHGVQTSNRRCEDAEVDAYRARFGRFAVLASGLSHWINFPLLLHVARAHPDMPLVIAGKRFPLAPDVQKLNDALFALPNVHYLGILHPEALKNLVRAASVGLVAYDFEETRAEPGEAGRTPLKALTYLAQHCPVVSTNNSYVHEVEGRGFFKAADTADFLTLLNDVLTGARGVDAPVIDSYLDSVEYGALCDRILHALAQPTAPLTGEDGRRRIPQGHPVIIISNEAWDGPRYSKHRTAAAMAPNRVTVFIDPAQHWRPSNLVRWRIQERDTPEGVAVISYYNAVPFLGGPLRGLNDRIIGMRLRRHLRRTGRYKPIVWTFDPSRLVSPQVFDPIISVYHCADDHRLGIHDEAKLAARVDHIFCIAKGLMPRFSALNPSVHHVPHGLLPADFGSGPSQEPPFPAGYGLYIGNVNDRHDFVLWEKLMRAHPAVHWVVVGPVKVSDPAGIRLTRQAPLPNVTFTGLVPYSRLRDLIAGCGFGFLYMKPDLEANRISSQKVVQFLAHGKPFFCSWLSEYADHPELVYMSDSQDEALARFAQWHAQGEAPDAQAIRRAHAEGLLYQRMFERLPFKL